MKQDLHRHPEAVGYAAAANVIWQETPGVAVERQWSRLSEALRLWERRRRQTYRDTRSRTTQD